MNNRNTSVGLFTGRLVDPFQVDPDAIVIEDVAHSLSHQCRFNGHCSKFYSVAEHCVEVSRHVPPSMALWGLLHDAAETYLSDVVRPVKRALAARVAGEWVPIGDFEDHILAVIASRFRLATEFMPAAVAEADVRMLATERAQLFDHRQPVWRELEGVEPYPVLLMCLPPEKAETVFLERFRQLCP